MSHYLNWKQWGNDVPDEYRLFTMTLIDWVGYFLGQQMTLFPYGMFLCNEMTQGLSQHNRQLVEQVGVDHLHTYLTRTYLVERSLSLDVYPTPMSSEWCLLVLSTLYCIPVFHPVILPIPGHGHPLNELRSQQGEIKKLFHELVNRDDITDSRDEVDHGALFSLSLGYGLRLAHVVFTYAAAVTDHSALTLLAQSVSDLYLHLQRSWQCHVSMVPH